LVEEMDWACWTKWEYFPKLQHPTRLSWGVAELRACSRPAIHNHSEKTHVVRDLRACSRWGPANHSGANPPNREIKSTQRPGDQAKTLCQAKSQNSI
jgi:hypothetical protein